MKNLIPLYVKMQSKIPTLARDEKGATMVEYGLMLALIAVVCITAVTLIGTNADLMFDQIAAALG